MNGPEIASVATVVMGQSPPGSTCSRKPIGLPLLNGPTEFGSRYPTPAQWTTAAARIAEPGDLLLCVRGSTTGRMNRADQQYAIGRGIAAIRGNNVVDTDYISFAMLHDLPALLAKTSGSVFPNLSSLDIKSHEIAWPDAVVRANTVAVLSALDDKIDLNRRINGTIQNLVRAAFQQLDGAGEDVPIGDLAKVVGGSTPSTANDSYWTGGTFAWATPKDLAGLPDSVLLDTARHVTEAGLTQISSGLLPVGTVLISSRAPIGYLAISEVPVAVNQGFIALVPNGRLSSYFLLRWAEAHMDEIKARANGTTFQEISKANFRPITVHVPGEIELKHFDEGADLLHSLLVANARESQTLALLRDALLPELMSGRMIVR